MPQQSLTPPSSSRPGTAQGDIAASSPFPVATFGGGPADAATGAVASLPPSETPTRAADFFDVTNLAVKAGFLVPVALSPLLWRDLCAVPEDSSQDVYDRLCDVFFMARWMIAKEPILAIRELTFTFPLPVRGNEENEDYGVRLVTANADRGEAGIVLYRQGEQGERGEM